MSNGTKTTSKYCNKRLKKLKACIKGVSSDMQQIFLHHYNARSHMSVRKPVNIDCFDFTVLGHPQYNKKWDHIFPNMKDIWQDIMPCQTMRSKQ
jgi:hypothetical protein